MTAFIESATCYIPVRSERQALDWSLVLLSQGIECRIEHSEEAGWGLMVAARDEERAIGVIRLYLLENLRWPWRRTIQGKVIFDWGSAAWVILLLVFYWIQSRSAAVAAAGMMDSAAVSRGEWWRLFTSLFLHADIGHLAANAGLGLVLLGLAMGTYGTGVGLLAAYLAGVGGNLVSWKIDPSHLSLGASGMVMGCVGLIAAGSMGIGRANGRLPRSLLAGLAAGVMLFLLLGSSSNPQVDLAAHAGGFLAGLALGIALSVLRPVLSTLRVNLVCGLLFSILIVTAWWAAMR